MIFIRKWYKHIRRKKLKPIFEEESKENNRFTIKNIIKEKNEDINKEIDYKVNELLRVRILNPEDLKITNIISYILSPGELGQKKDE